MIVRIGEPDDIPALQAIEKKARTGYAPLAGFEFVAAGPPIAADRRISGTIFIAEVSKALVGFALVQPMDGVLYLAISPCSHTLQDAALALGSSKVFAYARDSHAKAVTLATFRLPPWNGPWFRRHDFTTMPRSEVGAELRGILTRHASFLDMKTRETLWLPITTIPSAGPNP
jgi:hypothetical protein